MHTIDLRLERARISEHQGTSYLDYFGKLYGKHSSEVLMYRSETAWQSQSQKLDSDSSVPNFNEQVNEHLDFINKKREALLSL